LAILVPDVAKPALQYLFWVWSSLTSADRAFQIHLCKAPPTLDESTTLADLVALEADFTDYAIIPLTGPTDTGVPGPGDPDIFNFDPVSWMVITPTVGNTIYAYWIDALAAGDVRSLLWAEPMPVPVPMLSIGDLCAFTPAFWLQQF
jgi:hypothetical protein